MSAMTLHHIPDTDHILRVFHDLLKPGGWLAIADLDREDGSFHEPKVDVQHGFDRAALATKAKAVGLAAPTSDAVFSIDKGTGDARRSYRVSSRLAGGRGVERLKRCAATAASIPQQQGLNGGGWGWACATLTGMSYGILSRIVRAMPLGMGTGLFRAQDLTVLVQPQARRSDLESLRADWRRIGGDFRVAAQKLEAELTRNR